MTLITKKSMLADLQTQMPRLKQAVMRGNCQAQISARLGNVPENDPNFVQRSAEALINRLMLVIKVTR
jgi:hypothetical protein